MGTIITDQQAEDNLRSLGAISSSTLDDAIRYYALLKQAERAERLLPDQVEKFTTKFGQNRSVPIADDARLIREMAWPVMQEYLTTIIPDVTGYELGGSGTKPVTLYNMREKFLKHLERYDVTNSLSTNAELKEVQLEILQDFHIPMIQSKRDVVLEEAIRRKIFEEPMTEQHKEKLTQNSAIVEKWELALSGMGIEILAYPFQGVDVKITRGLESFGEAFWPGKRPAIPDIDTTEKIVHYDNASREFTRALSALQIVLEQIGEHDTNLNIEPDAVNNFKDLASALAEIRKAWEKTYNDKISPQLKQIYRTLRSFTDDRTNIQFTTDQKEWVTDIWNSIPLSLGSDKLLEASIISFQQTLEKLETILAKSGNNVNLNSEEFSYFYAALITLQERVGAPAKNIRYLADRMADLEAGNTPFLLTNSVEFSHIKSFVRAAQEVTQTTANGHGNPSKSPKSPQSVRNSIAGFVTELNDCLQPSEIAEFTLRRCWDSIIVLQDYITQQAPILAANLESIRSKATIENIPKKAEKTDNEAER